MGAKAAPGDTTWVQANDVWLTYNNNYDTAIRLPDASKTYRKILMIFTLGKYSCPGYDPNNAGDKAGQTGWCGDWDYTVQNIFMSPKGDTLEIGRLITPYARENAPRTPKTWTERYTYDVTDFYPVLRDTGTVRIHYSGYSGGFTANIKFAYIEGTPPRDVVGVERLWNRSYAYGKTPSIDDRIPSINKTAPANTVSAEVGLTISGHGSDATGCSEFCKKYYEVTLNNSNFDKTLLWRDNCGSNHLYPQSGTWLSERGNWCPGDVVFPNTHKLAGITASSNYDLDIDFEDYTSASGNASYIVGGNVFYYGAFNHNLDASLDDVIAPSDHEVHFRQNPFTGKPIVTVRNTGSATITSIKFEYGIVGKSTVQYTWNGSLASLLSTDIELDVLPQLQAAEGKQQFTAKILEVNGTTDDDASNNSISSGFVGAARWPGDLMIQLTTNKSTNSLGKNETSWQIINIATGQVAAERKDNDISKTYRDTLSLPDGMYKLVVNDQGCDGIKWWAYIYYSSNPGNGVFRVKSSIDGSDIDVPANFDGDFGCGFTHYFNVGWPASVTNVQNAFTSMEVYPNPANKSITIDIATKGMVVDGVLRVMDMTGRVVTIVETKSAQNTIDVSSFTNGIYFVSYSDNGISTPRLMQKVVVSH